MDFLPFILRRARRHWQILLTVALGVFLSTALLAASPLLVNTVVEFGLRRTLLSAAPLAGHLRLKAFGQVDAARFAEVDTAVQQITRNTLRSFTSQIIPTAGTRWLHPWLDGQIIEDQRVNFSFYGMGDTDIAQHVTFVAGDWPDVAVNGTTVHAVIGQEFAQAYALQVGDTLPLSIERDETEATLQLQVSGIIQANDPRDPYWFGEFSPLRAQSDERWLAQYAAIVSAADFFTISDQLFADSTAEQYWYTLIVPEAISAPTIPLVRARLARLITDLGELSSPSVRVDSGLDDILANFAAQTTAVRAPLYFLTAEVVLLTLYYVTMVAALAVRQVEREFSVLQSRGASRRQIIRIQAIEAVIISVAALVSGPGLAVVLVRGITIFGPLADVSEPDWALTVPQAAWLAAIIAALACVIGLLLPVNRAVNRSIVAYQQTAVRDTDRPFWQRYYLDVFLVVIGLVLLWRLQFYGSIVGGGSSRPQVDWLLLLSPVALLVGAGTILLRIFPLFLSGLSAITSRAKGLPAALAMWQASRNPKHVARLVLLLTLAISLGILATGINATLDQSEVERSRYATGGEIRLVSRRDVPLSAVKRVSDVTEATGIWRNQGSVSIGRDYFRFEVLAIDPEAFAAQTQYRGDFSAQPMGQLLGSLVLAEPLAQPTTPLPGQPAEFGFWLWSGADPGDENLPILGDSDLDRIGVEAKFVTALDERLTLRVTPTETGGYPSDGWRYFRAEVPLLSEDSYPLALHSIWFRNRTRTSGNFGRSVGNSFLFVVDDLTAVDAQTGQTTLFEGMENLTTIWQLGNDVAAAAYENETVHSGRSSHSLFLNMLPSFLAPFQLVVTQDDDVALPALVSPAFVAQTEAAVGDIMQLSIDSDPFKFQIVGVVNYFPTMYEDLNAGYLITNRDAILYFLNRSTSQSINSNEALVAVAEDVAVEDVSAAAVTAVASINQAWEAETIRKQIKADPMGLGLRSVTYFGYILTTALSLIGFATYFYLSARQKSAIYGVLRSLGMSSRQLYGSLVMEQVVLILAGLTVGTVLGVVLNQITLPGLPITFGERPPTPPFLAQNDWVAVGRIYLSLTIAFFLSLGIATALLWRTQLHRVLRVGEE
jgi:ABC-type antimicrobial peptide transport system permease subunit